ncbi:MAG: hypothetical protein EKK31_22240 [Hyphomicrobiales bacterium]|nr:MAG: hypothetical protein EKK31_22240 [Hyphomicrobiales bacterium]
MSNDEIKLWKWLAFMQFSMRSKTRCFLGFVDFGDLASIIVQNWDFFKEIMPGQDWNRQRLEDLLADFVI